MSDQCPIHFWNHTVSQHSQRGTIVTVDELPKKPADLAKPKQAFRICALCRHFRVDDNGQEFPGIADSAYIRYSCAVLGWESREDYLMDSEPTEAYQKTQQPDFDCPHWESL